MKLTKDEKRLLKELVDAWELEGCYTTMPACWVRDDCKERRPGPPTEEEAREGDNRFKDAMKGLDQKLGFALFYKEK